MKRRDAQNILDEARANVERLRGGFADREEIQPTESYAPRVETMKERHLREITEQEQRFELERMAAKERERRGKVRHTRTVDAAWERWADAKIAAALETERKDLAAALAAVGQVAQALADQIEEMQGKIDKLEEKPVVDAKGSGVIDLPNPVWKRHAG